jgi:hypothetical protein
LELLSVKDSDVDPMALSRDGRKDQIIEALNRSTIKASQIRPLIMAIEDIQRKVDPEFKEILKKAGRDENRSLSNFAKHCLLTYLKEKKGIDYKEKN